MKTVMKNLLLGSVAGLAMVGTAAAADLPVKAKAAEYVKICSTYGAGFYYIPGTDTCVKLGGFAQSDYYVQTYDGIDVDAGDNRTFFQARGAIKLDSRTQTEYGTLRTYTEFRMRYSTDGVDGQYTPASSTEDFDLDKGYIQFAGFTFGKVQSFFDFYANDGIWFQYPATIASDQNTIAAAYTADFGNGWGATIAIEDATYRRSGLQFESDDYLVFQGGFPFPIFSSETGYYGATYGGQEVPDIVGNLTYDGEWGSFKLSGAAHQINGIAYKYDVDTFPAPFPPIVTDVNNYENSLDEWGWAVKAGVKLNLTMLAPDDTLWLEVGYAEGATGYTGLNDYFDAYVNPITQDVEKTKSWNVVGEFNHYWTPTVYSTVYGGWGQADRGYYGDATNWDVGTILTWMPVKGLQLGVLYEYGDISVDVNDEFVDNDTVTQLFGFSAKRSF